MKALCGVMVLMCTICAGLQMEKVHSHGWLVFPELRAYLFPRIGG